MVDWKEEIRYYGIDLENIDFWEAGPDTDFSVRDGIKLTIEKLEELEKEFPEGLYLRAWYKGNGGEDSNIFIVCQNGAVSAEVED